MPVALSLLYRARRQRYLRHGLLVVEAALVLLAEHDVRRLLVEPDAEAVELLLDNLLVRHALSEMRSAPLRWCDRDARIRQRERERAREEAEEAGQHATQKSIRRERREGTINQSRCKRD